MNQEPQLKSADWPPRLVIAAPQGRSGKTILSVGLCSAFARRGLVVQPFKRGPDYIDPSWLTAASGRACRNLDLILMPEEQLTASFERGCCGADLALIEGAMGLYDGMDSSGTGSTAQVSRLLGCPVVLVINASRMTRSAAALVNGFRQFEPGIDIQGVILNNVSGSRHVQKLVSAIEQYCGLPVLGCLPRDSRLSITERHLGLIPFPEGGQPSSIDVIASIVQNNVDLEGILKVARRAGSRVMSQIPFAASGPERARLGVLHDNVFTFYYPENLEALRNAGAGLVFIDSLHDTRLPAMSGLYIGGGFPELFLPQLEANLSLRQDIARAVEDGMPVYAECAGLMYLCRSILAAGRRHHMVGAIPADIEICDKPQGHGYAMLEVTAENCWLPVGLRFWGHEFHYSKIVNLEMPAGFAYRVLRGHGIDGEVDGFLYKSMLASYIHLHSLGVPQWAKAFVAAAEKWASPTGSVIAA